MKKINFKNLLFVSLLAFSFALSFSAFAQGTMGNPSGGTMSNPAPSGSNNPPTSVRIEIKDPFKLGDNLYDLVYAVLNKAVLPIGGVIVVIMIIYSGFLFVTARGSEDKLKTAKASFFTACVGAAILLGAVAIGKAIEATINAFK